MGVLDEHCDRLGRTRTDICRTRLGSIVVGRTMEDARATLKKRFGDIDAMPAEFQDRLRNMFIVGDVDSVGEQLQAFKDAGLDGMVTSLIDPTDLDAIALTGETLGRVFR